MKRHWARDNGGSPLLTTYSYDGNTGELTDIVYADGTHGVTFEYTRAGLIDTVDDELGGHTFAYTAYLEPLSETIDITGILTSEIVLTRAFETNAVGRLNDLQVGTTADPDAHYQANYYYESATARMSRVTGPGLPGHGAEYEYLTEATPAPKDSDLINSVQFKSGPSTTLASATREYEDYRDLIKSVENKWEPTTTTLSKYEYAYDPIGRPQWVVRTGTAFAGSGHTDLWNYDDRNELTDAKRYDSGTAPPSDPPPNPDTAKFFNWLYDNAGNRSDYDVGSPATEQTDYFANGLNQYTWTDYDGPGADARQSIEFDDDGNLETIFITGDMNCDGVFDVNDVTAFYLALNYPATYATTYPNCNILNGDINGDGVLDAADDAAFWALYASGNGGLWQTHVWNAENRLIAVEPAGTLPTEGVTKVAFAYDYMGRRIEKKVWQNQESAWVLIGHTKFIYDGWLLLLELNGLSGDAVLKKYTWGLDLSRTLQGAGGIGGLLATHVVSGAKDYLYYYDNLGNVGQMTDHSGTFVAKYEYNAYGGVQTKSGSYAGKNPFRFSTKYFDDETGLGYWGFRYYSPSLGRWLNRDPIAEIGARQIHAIRTNVQPNGPTPLGHELQLYSFVINAPVAASDAFGLHPIGSFFDCIPCVKRAKAKAEKDKRWYQNPNNWPEHPSTHGWKVWHCLNTCYLFRECAADLPPSQRTPQNWDTLADLIRLFGVTYEAITLFGHSDGNGSIKNEFDGQCPISWLLDTPGDIVANELGLIIGRFPSAFLSCRKGCELAYSIPGPYDPVPVP